MASTLELSLVTTFGTAAIAANAVSGTIVMFQVLPGMAIGLGLTVVISRCVGAGDYEECSAHGWLCLLTGLLRGLFVYSGI
ncbi:MATE family efflux transporter [Clostridium estertheticum]|uniref:MATE family efflux transporter n=1 Tax=Clostridium estertheticum TaxID=238834 RepID=UPI0035CCEEB4